MDDGGGGGVGGFRSATFAFPVKESAKRMTSKRMLKGIFPDLLMLGKLVSPSF